MMDPVVLIAVLTMLARIISKALWARGVAAVVRAAGPGSSVVCRRADGTELTVLPGGAR
jgi:hypothetical protein